MSESLWHDITRIGRLTPLPSISLILEYFLVSHGALWICHLPCDSMTLKQGNLREFSWAQHVRVINLTKSRVIHLLKSGWGHINRESGFLQHNAAMKFSALFVFTLSPAAFATPLPRALPTPVSVATAKTYLSERKFSAQIWAPIHADTRPRMISCRRSRFQRSSLRAQFVQDLGYKCVTFQLFITGSWKLTYLSSFWHLRYPRKWVVSWRLVNGVTLKDFASLIAVLKRDGTNVVTDSACKALSGNWVSPYDNVPTTLASDLDIVGVISSFLPYHLFNNFKYRITWSRWRK